MQARSLPADVFYDREVVGVAVHDETHERGDEPSWTTVWQLEPDEFYRQPGTPRSGTVARLLARVAARPYRFAAVLALVGFMAVFVNQAPLVYQVVLGAPIFEEFVKFGLALTLVVRFGRWPVGVSAPLQAAAAGAGAWGVGRLLGWPIAWLFGVAAAAAVVVMAAAALARHPVAAAPLRLAVALGVGCAFGVLEHTITYAEETGLGFVNRVLFHAGATGLSMASFHVLQSARPRASVWASTLLATFIHYVNNSLAILFIGLALAPAAIQELAAQAVSWTATGLTFLAAVGVLVLARPFRAWVSGAVSRWLATAAPDPPAPQATPAT